METLKFMENNPELTEEIYKLPFKPWHACFMMLLNKSTLSSGKEKAILKNKNPKVTFGILVDHFMGLARRFEIPQVYIKKLSYKRYWNKSCNSWDELKEEKKENYNYEINSCTLELVQALYEKVRRVQHEKVRRAQQP